MQYASVNFASGSLHLLAKSACLIENALIVKDFINKFAFGECLANWEWHSKAYKEYCKQYGNDEKTPSGELKYDRYIDRLAKAERKEFYENSIENMQKYCSKWKIVKIQILYFQK